MPCTPSLSTDRRTGRIQLGATSSSINRRGVLLPAMVAAMIGCAPVTIAQAEDARVSQATTEQLQQWILDLDSEQFETRQAASRHLRQMGPVVIEPVRQAALDNSPEVTRRAVDLLRHFLLSDDVAAGYDAHLALLSLTETGDRTAAYRAAAALRSRHDVAMARIRSLGGTVDDDADGASDYRGPRVFLQKSWRGGDDGMAHLRHLNRFEYLSLKDAPISGRGLSEMAEFAQLRWLSLRGTRVDDDTVAAIARQPRLEWLSLEETDVTDQGLRHVAHLSHLEKLYIGEAEITGAGLVHLKSLRDLKYLSMKELDIADESLAHLKDLTGLEHLGLDDTPVTDAALVHLKNLSNLRTLWLTRSQVSDEGLAQLTHLKSLSRLYLDGTAVTDAGLEQLHPLTELERIGLSQTKVTDAGVEALRRALPHVHVDR